MRVASIDRYDMVNNPGSDGIALTVWFQGCSIHCPGCHNPELWSHDGAQIDVNGIMSVMRGKVRYTDMILLGGEPLEQSHDELAQLMIIAHELGMKVWLYTSYELGDIPPELLQHAQVVKTGKYDESLKSDGILASSNQRLWDRVPSDRYIEFKSMRGENNNYEHRIIFAPWI